MQKSLKTITTKDDMFLATPFVGWIEGNCLRKDFSQEHIFRSSGQA